MSVPGIGCREDEEIKQEIRKLISHAANHFEGLFLDFSSPLPCHNDEDIGDFAEKRDLD